MKTYKGLEYIVYFYKDLGFYCGYVKLPKGHPYEKLFKKEKIKMGTREIELEVGYENMDISCHGGLTFSVKITKENQQDYPQGFSLGYWIGWDYGHFGDKTALFNGIEHSAEEVEAECKNVIEQLLKIKQEVSEVKDL